MTLQVFALSVLLISSTACLGKRPSYDKCDTKCTSVPTLVRTIIASAPTPNAFVVAVTTAFAPRSRTELHDAVDACIKLLSTVGDCSKGLHGPIGSWDVSAVTDMHSMFAHVQSFNQDLSAWDVSTVTDMSGMFNGAQSFNQDLSAWDVSSVTNMQAMFSHA